MYKNDIYEKFQSLTPEFSVSDFYYIFVRYNIHLVRKIFEKFIFHWYVLCLLVSYVQELSQSKV